MDNSWLVVAVLFATVLLRIALVLGIIWLLIPPRRRCPRCAEDGLSAVASRAARLLGLEWRWCLACGWQGLSKRPPATPAPVEHTTHTPA